MEGKAQELGVQLSHVEIVDPRSPSLVDHYVRLLLPDWRSRGVTEMEALKRLADAVVKAPEGPVQVGVERRLLTSTSIHEIAAHYHSAFHDGIRCFPYFAPEKNAH